MKSPIRREYKSAIQTVPYTLKALTDFASLFFPAPMSLAMWLPPPIPKRLAKEMFISMTVSVIVVAATI